jgi:hypothetical protein
MALSALVTLFGNIVSDWLGVGAVSTKLLGLVVFVISLYWLASNLKCRACGLKLLWYAFGHAKNASWLDWLLHQTECPKCGYQQKSHVGSEPSAQR